jgi:hypothetical protein
MYQLSNRSNTYLFYDTILYYHSRNNHHPILIAIDIATLILQSATVLGKIKKDRIIEMGIWANLLGTNEDKINFAAIPANNHYASNERPEIAEHVQQRFWIPQYLGYKLIRKEAISN